MNQDNFNQLEKDEELQEIIERKVKERMEKEREKIKQDAVKEVQNKLKTNSKKKKEATEKEEMSRRSFLKKLGLGAAGLGAASLIPSASADFQKLSTQNWAQSNFNQYTDTDAKNAAPIQTINGKTGSVNLNHNDVGAKPDTYTAPVQSINGQTGNVNIDTSGGDYGGSFGSGSWNISETTVNGRTPRDVVKSFSANLNHCSAVVFNLDSFSTNEDTHNDGSRNNYNEYTTDSYFILKVDGTEVWWGDLDNEQNIYNGGASVGNRIGLPYIDMIDGNRNIELVAGGTVIGYSDEFGSTSVTLNYSGSISDIKVI